MRRMDRYLARAIIVGTLAALLLLVSVNLIVDFAHNARLAGKTGGTMSLAVARTLLTAPRRVFEFFPTAMLLGSLLSLGNLAAHNELVVMRAAGMSLYQIAWAVLKAAAPLVLGVILLGEFVIPPAEQMQRSAGKPQGAGPVGLGSRSGLWARDGDRIINIGTVYPDMRVHNVYVYTLDDTMRLTEVTYARSGIYRGDYWDVRDVSRSALSEERILTEHAGEERWPRLVSPDTIDVVVVEPDRMSSRKLANYVEYLEMNNLDSARYELAFWQRFTVPLTALPLLLIAVPFSVGPTRSGGAGQRLFIGIVVGVTFHLLKESFNNIGLVYGLPPLIGAFLPVIVLFAIAALMIRRVN